MASTDTIVNIPVADIEETRDNEYIFGIEESDVSRLAEEIAEHGFTGSIDVVDLHNGKYQVFAGHQRLRAVKRLGWETIPCTISNDMPEEELYRKLLASNILNRKISPLGYARAIDAYKKEVLAKSKPAGKTRTLCSKFFNVSEGQVQRYLAILKTTPYVQELCKTGEIPYVPLADAVTFTPEQQQELEEQIKSFKRRNPNLSISMNILGGMIDNIKEVQRRKEAKEQVRRAQEALLSTPDEQDEREAVDEQVTAMQSGYKASEYGDDFSDDFADAMPLPGSDFAPSYDDEYIEPVVARTPSFSEDEAERLEKASSINGTPLPVFADFGDTNSFAGDELDDDEEEAVPDWDHSPAVANLEHDVAHAVDELVRAASRKEDVSDPETVLRLLKRAEDAIKAIREKFA